jgi:hypothetical protein
MPKWGTKLIFPKITCHLRRYPLLIENLLPDLVNLCKLRGDLLDNKLLFHLVVMVQGSEVQGSGLPRRDLICMLGTIALNAAPKVSMNWDRKDRSGPGVPRL